MNHLHRLTQRATLLIGALFLLTVSASAQIVFTVTATATSNSLGYTSGNSYTFVYTLNNYAPTTPKGSSLSGLQYNWSENQLSDPVLFNNFTGDGLSGTYVRHTENMITVTDSDQNSGNGGLVLSVGAENGTNGLSFTGGTGFVVVQLGATFAGLDFQVTNDGTPPDPATYFSNYLGTYSAVTTSNTYVFDGLFAEAYFTVNSVTIAQAAAVPEPSTYAAIFGLMALGFVGWRRRHQAARA